MGVAIKPDKFKKFLEKNHWVLRTSGRNEIKGTFLNTVNINGKNKTKNASLMFGAHRSEISINAITRIKKQFEKILEKKFTTKEFAEHINKNRQLIKL